MNIAEINNMIHNDDQYKFLWKDSRIKDRLCLVTLGGSYAYGMNKEGSDVDIRGIATNPYQEILLGKDFDQVVEVNTDTTIYSMNKILQLLTSCNPIRLRF